ncbi:Myosin-2 heavy chain, non muscle [Rhizoctonia solani]|uniref:Myosin-2 heavy chain, non muscle n=1 Tax=Rhizoctonia solani TaxID=456999 RepID=A0A0K6FWH5_9AGAM|nr:Myosin-2 heavy chain, non muscle [Rhizoctonia solani]
MLGKLPATTTLVDERGHVIKDPTPGPSNQGAPATTHTPLDLHQNLHLDLLGLKGDKIALGYMQCLRNAFESNDPEIMETWRTAGETMLEESITRFSPTVKQRQTRMEIRYRTYIYHMCKLLPLVDQWKESVFRKHWVQFLASLLASSKGADGGRVRVDTFNQWCTDLIWLVGQNLINDQGERIGSTALTTGGLYAEFRNVSFRLSVQFELNRTPGQRLWIGQLELLLIYQVAVRMSEKYGRASAIQTILSTSMVFHIGARVGSLGWSNKQYLEEERYMKCGDVRIEREDYGIWNAEVTVTNRKGWNTASESARPVTYKLSAVTKTQNLFFDTPTLLLLHLWHRRALKGIKSIEDIFNYEGQYFEIEEWMRDKPLFLERAVKGLELLEDQPASAKGMTLSFKASGTRAGFTVTTMHALRRDAGNVFALVLGAHIAQLLLGHHEADTVLNTNYSKGTFNVPVVEARLGLLDEQLSLSNRIGLQRHRREGQVAHALLNAGFQFSTKQAAKEDADGSDPDGSDPDGSEGESSEPEENKPKERKGVRGDPLVELDEEQTARIENHPSVAKRTQEIEEAMDELYMLFPPAAAKTHGSRARDKLSGMLKKYHDSTIVVQNLARIEELLETINQASDDRVKARQKLTRQERSNVTRGATLAERKNPKIYPTEAVKQARTHAEEMAKVVNMPKPSEQLQILDSIKNLPNFGENLLSDECRELLAGMGAKDLLETNEAEEAQEPEDRLADEDDEIHDANGAPKITMTPFKDVDDLKVLDVDLVETKKEWMACLVKPLIIDEFYKRLAEANNGNFPCLLCRALPEHLKPVSAITGKKGQDTFGSRAKLHRHENAVHTPWVDLMQYMITDDPKVFKCPSNDCSFRASTIEKVRDHCLSNCNEHELYEDMESKHELRQEEKRKATPSRANVKLEKQKQELRGYGLQLEEKTIQGVEKISTTSPEEAFKLAAKRKIPESDVRSHLHALDGLNERARLSINEDGVVKDPYVNRPMEKVSKSLLTPEINAEIDARLAKKK